MIISKEFELFIREYMDLSDRDTLHELSILDESDKGKVAANLTSKLYDKIISKVYDIDFGTIPQSRGDITKIENYDSLLETIKILSDIVKQYRQPTTPIDILTTAIDNIRSRKDLFTKAYTINTELPIIVYNTTVLSIVSSVSYLISGCIEYIQSPETNTYQIALDKVSYNHSKDNLLFENLSRFNKACYNKELDKTLNELIHINAKRLSGTAVALSAVAIIGLSRFIIPFLQDIVYFFFNTRQSISDYFAVQADLLQMNAANVIYRDNISDKNTVADKQNKIANRFRKVSNFFDIEYKKAKNDAQKLKDIDRNDKFKMSDITKSDGSTNSLF